VRKYLGIVLLAAAVLGVVYVLPQKKPSEGDLCPEAVRAQVTFIEFGSVNCIPCRAMQPVMRELERRFGDQIRVAIRRGPWAVPARIHGPGAWSCLHQGGAQSRRSGVSLGLFRARPLRRDRSGGYIDAASGKLSKMDADQPDYEMGQEDVRTSCAPGRSGTASFLAAARKAGDDDRYGPFLPGRVRAQNRASEISSRVLPSGVLWFLMRTGRRMVTLQITGLTD